MRAICASGSICVKLPMRFKWPTIDDATQYLWRWFCFWLGSAAPKTVISPRFHRALLSVTKLLRSRSHLRACVSELATHVTPTLRASARTAKPAGVINSTPHSGPVLSAEWITYNCARCARPDAIFAQSKISAVCRTGARRSSP